VADGHMFWEIWIMRLKNTGDTADIYLRKVEGLHFVMGYIVMQLKIIKQGG